MFNPFSRSVGVNKNSYSDALFRSKLGSFDASQQSIQALSSWIISNKDHCDEIVHLWSIEYYKVPIDRKLTFLYLANDIMQTSKRSTLDFIDRFTTVIPKAISTLMRESDDTTRAKANRLLLIWRDRQVLPEQSIEEICKLPFVDLGSVTSKPNNTTIKPIIQKPKPQETPKENTKLPDSIKDIVDNNHKLLKYDLSNFLLEDNLTAKSKASIFPWTPQSKNILTVETASEKLSDVKETHAAAIKLKEQLEKDLEERSEYINLIDNLKYKQEAILLSNMTRLQDCIKFLENINTARTDLEEYTSSAIGQKRYMTDLQVPPMKVAKYNLPPALPTQQMGNYIGYNSQGLFPVQNTEYTITERPPPLQ